MREAIIIPIIITMTIINTNNEKKSARMRLAQTARVACTIIIINPYNNYNKSK